MVSRYYIKIALNIYFIPIWIDTISKILETVYNSLTSPVKLIIKQKLYFKKHIIIKPGMDFLLIIVL
jgi:hypothetical protein